MRVTHNERLCSVVTTSTAFELRKFSINPGLAGTFPWLCDVANRFDKYKFVNIQFHYVENSPAAAGNVTLAFDFDPNDDDPVSMDQAVTYHDFISTSIWKGASLRPDLSNGDKLPQKNTRPGLPLADIDLNNYDVGNLFVLTEGAAAATVGYVEVSYTVDLFIHQVQNGIGDLVSNNAGLNATHLFGTIASLVADADGFLPGSVTATNTFVFDQPFEGIIGYNIIGTGLSDDVDLDGTLTNANIGMCKNAGSTSVVGFDRVSAHRGDTLVPTVTATTVTSITLTFSRCPYNAAGA